MLGSLHCSPKTIPVSVASRNITGRSNVPIFIYDSLQMLCWTKFPSAINFLSCFVSFCQFAASIMNLQKAHLHTYHKNLTNPGRLWLSWYLYFFSPNTQNFITNPSCKAKASEQFLFWCRQGWTNFWLPFEGGVGYISIYGEQISIENLVMLDEENWGFTPSRRLAKEDLIRAPLWWVSRL